MKTPRAPNTLIGIAGVHYVVSELSMRGLIALPTIRNTAGYDIIVATSDGKHHKNLQVKASSKRVTFWLMPPRRKIRAGPNDYYVLVRRLEKEKPPRFEAFLVSGKEAKKKLYQPKGRDLRSVGFDGRWAKNEDRERRWAKAWREWDGRA